MAEKDFIVAIELGSSKITGMAGRKNSDGSIQLLACASEDSSSFIRKGLIYNLNKTAHSLTSIINTLEGALDAKISKVYVGVGGQSLRGIKNRLTRRLEGESTITQEIVDSINDENRGVPLVDMEILDVAPQEYRIGNNFQIDPVGVFGNNIESTFLNIIARSSVKRNLEKCFEEAKIDVFDYFISPIALANVVLTDSEKRSGCALVDFGADTTTVSVYKNNILRHLVVLPIGSNSITEDITELQVEEPEAEQLKIEYGSAINNPPQDGEEPSLITLQDKRTIDESILNDIIEARTEEIIANVWNQIQLSSYGSQLLAGVMLTGGGANLRNLEEAFRKKTKVDKVKTIKGILLDVKATTSEMMNNDGRHNTILGLLQAGEYNCCEPDSVKPVNVLIDEVDEQEKAKQDEDRKRRIKEQEEEEKRRKEQEREKKKEKKERINKWLGGITRSLFDETDDQEMK